MTILAILAIVAIASFATVLLIWLGDPLLVWAVASVHSRPLVEAARDSKSQRRSVSVILATRDSEELIRARIANLFDSAHPAQLVQIVVALDCEGARCSREQLVEGGIDSRVVVVNGDPPGGKAGALNAAVRIARGDILVMADSAQRFDRETIPQLVAALGDPRFGAVSGALVLGGAANSPVHRYWAMEKWLRFNESMIHSSIGVTGAVYAIRRELWPVVPEGTLLDDVFVPMSLVMAGHRVGFRYEARAWDVRAFDANAESVRKTRTLTGVLQLRSLIPGLLSPSKNPVWAQFVAHKLLRLTTPLFMAIGAVSAAMLFVLLLARADAVVQIAFAVVVAVMFLIPAIRVRLLSAIRWGWSMQKATTNAAYNGIRSRWQVWSR